MVGVLGWRINRELIKNICKTKIKRSSAGSKAELESYMTEPANTKSMVMKQVQRQNGLYFVIEARTTRHEPFTWVAISKGYVHSTSAFAALGRLYQKELLGK